MFTPHFLMEVELGDGKDIDRVAIHASEHVYTEYQRHRLSDFCIEFSVDKSSQIGFSRLSRINSDSKNSYPGTSANALQAQQHYLSLIHI